MRLRYVPVTAGILLDFMKINQSHTSVELVANGLPADARLVRMGVANDGFGWVNLVVESIDFDDVPEGGEIPRHPTPTFRKVY